MKNTPLEPLLAEYDRTVTRNPWIPVKPHPQQALFLTYPAIEVFFGGAVGGGKSAGLTMSAAQYVEVPGYHSLLLRRNKDDLWKPDGLIPISMEWWGGTDAHFDNDILQWTFPSSATITYGHINNETDKYRWKGPRFQHIGFDELTQFTASMYRYLFSRLGKKVGVPVPLRVRSGSNPDGIGAAWVRERFIKPHDDPARVFIPSKLEDNPSLDLLTYDQSLRHLDPIEYARLRHGDWDVVDKNGVFNAENLEKMRALLKEGLEGSIVWEERMVA